MYLTVEEKAEIFDDIVGRINSSPFSNGEIKGLIKLKKLSIIERRKVNDKEDILQCKICGGLYLGSDNLYEHIDLAHNKGEDD